MASFLSSAISAISDSSVGSAIVRILIARGISSLINRSSGSDNASTTPTQTDEGVRLQLQPNTTNPIPLLFGSAYFGGNITDVQLTDNNKTLWVCLTLSEAHTANRFSDNTAVNTYFDEIYFNNQLITFKADGITVDHVTNLDGTVDTSPQDLVKIYLYKNGSANPVMPTGYSGTLPVDARSLMPGWTSNHTMSELTFALVKITYNRDKGITSVPDFKFKLSNTLYKPGDAIYSYLTNSISGAGLTDSEIDLASLSALNTYADEAINYLDESDNTVKTLADRYQINGIINPEKTVMANLQELANASGCFIKYDIATGKWGIRINRDADSVAHFDDSNIIGGIDLTGTSLDSMYNSVEVEFPHRQLQDQTDTLRIDLPDEFRNANEPDNILTFRASMLNEPLQARELAYLELYQNRMDQVVTFTTDYSKINTEAGDVITVSSSVYNWTNQPFRVIRVKEIESEQGGLAVEITAQEYDATMYTAGGQPRRPRVPSTIGSTPTIGIIGTPSAPTTTTANNNRLPSILITGTVPATGIVDRFEFWYSTDNWTTSIFLNATKNSNGSPFNGGTSLSFRASNLPAATYKFKVRAGNDSGFSAYSDSSVEVIWDPVQTTDQVTANTTVDTGLGSLLPTLGMGALAYFAYKALYPEIVKQLDGTQLGKLLGMPNSADAIARAAELEQSSTAYRHVVVDGVALESLTTDETILLLAGDGIELTPNAATGEITITATGGGAGGPAFNQIDAGGTQIMATNTENKFSVVGGTGIKIDADSGSGTITITGTNLTGAPSPNEADGSFKTNYDIDFKEGNIKLLDNCQAVYTWPAKQSRTLINGRVFNIVSAGADYYDTCYRQNIHTILIDGKLSTGDYGGVWNNTNLSGKTLHLKFIDKVGNYYRYIAWKSWHNDGTPVVTPDVCDLDPWSRPLFPSVDYPANNELATYSMLSQILTLQDNGGLYFRTSASEYKSKTYAGKQQIYRFARVCSNADGNNPSYDFNNM
jgi:hypothetical protein